MVYGLRIVLLLSSYLLTPVPSVECCEPNDAGDNSRTIRLRLTTTVPSYRSRWNAAVCKENYVYHDAIFSFFYSLRANSTPRVSPYSFEKRQATAESLAELHCVLWKPIHPCSASFVQHYSSRNPISNLVIWSSFLYWRFIPVESAASRKRLTSNVKIQWRVAKKNR